MKMIKISITLATIFIAVSYGQLSSFADWSLTYTGEGIRLLDGGTGDSELHYLDNIDLNQLSTEVPNRMGQLADFTIKCSGNMLADRTVCAKVEVELLNTVGGSYNIVSCLV